MWRLARINRFYEILVDLEDRLGGCKRLSECSGKMNWPRRGVYFFFEHGEKRSHGPGFRVVRVGTHALKRGSRTSLWDRLRTHRGMFKGRYAGGGNHRGSIFRLHVGTAILRKEGLEKQYPTWGMGQSANREIRDHEYPIERKESQHIGTMPFLWLKVDDAPGPKSERAYVERNSIALLSNYGKLGTALAIDSPCIGWLGHYCKNEMVRKSGLWNVDHVTEDNVDPNFLDKFELKVRRM